MFNEICRVSLKLLGFLTLQNNFKKTPGEVTMMSRTLWRLGAAAVAILSVSAHAASLSVSPSSQDVISGSTVTITVTGSGFTNATNGGDFSVNWDPAVLRYVSTTIIDPPWDTSSITPTDVETGLLNRVDVFNFSGDPVGASGASFDIAQLTFDVIGGAGTSSDIGITASLLGWFEPDGLTPYTVDYGLGSVQVQAVPIPAAGLLFPVGPVCLAAVSRWARRRRLQPA